MENASFLKSVQWSLLLISVLVLSSCANGPQPPKVNEKIACETFSLPIIIPGAEIVHMSRAPRTTDQVLVVNEEFACWCDLEKCDFLEE